MNNEELLNRYSNLIEKGNKFGLNEFEIKEQIQNRSEILFRMLIGTKHG